MGENKILSEKFLEVLQHEGVVSIVSWGVETHVANTWNSYLVVTDDERILIPAYGFRKTEENVNVNNKVKLTLGVRMYWDIKTIREQAFSLMVRQDISARVTSLIL